MHAGFALVAVLLNACAAHFPVNAPRDDREMSVQSTPQPTNDPDSLLVVTFSGGGVRAAALAYGALETLRDTAIPTTDAPHRLLDEVDLISSVSGGSFTAAYYGLHGDLTFANYRDDFLERDLQSDLVWRLVNPVNWPKLLSKNYGRSDLVASFLDEKLFHHATLGKFYSHTGPEIQINATDLTQANYFSFEPEQFRWLCTEFSSYPVSRAVTASSAVPVIATSVLLHNYADHCAHELTAWQAAALQPQSPENEDSERARSLRSFTDTKRRPFVHLLDGGLTDNLGLRAAIMRLQHAPPESRLNLSRIKRLAFIVVNAETSPDEALDQYDRPLTFAESIGAATDVQIVRYNRESMRLLGQWLSQLRRERAKILPLNTYVIQLRISDLPNSKQRKHLRDLPTFMGLGDGGVDALTQAARSLLQQHPQYQRLVHDLGHTTGTPDIESAP